VLPAERVTLSIVTNSIDAPAQFWVDGAIDIIKTFAQRGAPTGSARSWIGRWWNIWGALDLVPVGNGVMVTRPVQTSPFVGASELTVRGNSGRITQADGFATYGEAVRIVRDRRGKATTLWLGGAQMVPHDANVAVMKRLAKKRSA